MEMKYQGGGIANTEENFGFRCGKANGSGESAGGADCAAQQRCDFRKWIDRG